MSVIVTISLKIDPDNTLMLLDLLEERVEDTRHFKGCEAFAIYGDETHPGSIMIYQVWSSRKDQKYYFSSRPENRLMELLEPFILEAPIVRSVDELIA